MFQLPLTPFHAMQILRCSTDCIINSLANSLVNCYDKTPLSSSVNCYDETLLSPSVNCYDETLLSSWAVAVLLCEGGVEEPVSVVAFAWKFRKESFGCSEQSLNLVYTVKVSFYMHIISISISIHASVYLYIYINL